MSIVINIGSLDVSEIREDLAKEITELTNIGVLIESDASQILLRDCKKTNIGASIKIPKGLKTKIVSINGEIKIDREYLEGLVDPIILLVNGKLTFHGDLNKEIIDEKIYMFMLNGELITPKSLSGIVQSKGQINGKQIVYKSDYILLNDKVLLKNRFLKSLKPGSKLVINNLFIVEDLDLDLLKDKVSNIQVLEKLVVLEKYDEILADYIDEYYQVDIHLVPEGKGDFKYIENDIKLDDNSLLRYKHNRLFVDGNVEIYLRESDIDFNEFIEYLACDKLVCDIGTYNIIKKCLDESIEVEIIKGKLLENSSKLVITDRFEEETTIKNHGKLIFEEGLDIDNLREKVISITNHGVIEVPQDIMSIIQNKTTANYGKIKVSTNKDDENKQLEVENVMYMNVAELKL